MVLDHELLVLDRELGYRCLSADRWGSTVNRLGPEPEIITSETVFREHEAARAIFLSLYPWLFSRRISL